MIGFLLSFRNRGNYDFGTDPNVSNNVQFFNSTFELSLFRMLTMTVGQVGTDDMGVDRLTANNFIDFFIYALFIFIMPIMFINIFTGISIDEIQTLINLSEAQNVSENIDYVLKFESLKAFKGKFKVSYWHFIIYFIKLFIIYVEELKKLKDSLYTHNYMNETFQNCKNPFDNDEMKAEVDPNEILDDKLNNILLCLDKMSNKFEYLEKKLNKIELQTNKHLDE
jgi:hypothetical protein